MLKYIKGASNLSLFDIVDKDGFGQSAGAGHEFSLVEVFRLVEAVAVLSAVHISVQDFVWDPAGAVEESGIRLKPAGCSANSLRRTHHRVKDEIRARSSLPSIWL